MRSFTTSPHDQPCPLSTASLGFADRYSTPVSIRRRSDRWDIATCCGRNGRGSYSVHIGDPSSNQATTPLITDDIHMI